MLDELDARVGALRRGCDQVPRGPAREPGDGRRRTSRHGPGGPAGRVAGVLSMTPLSPDEIAARLGEPVERVLSCLLSLEIEGYAAAVPGGRYVRGRRG